jgi:hypothetical protein
MVKPSEMSGEAARDKDCLLRIQEYVLNHSPITVGDILEHFDEIHPATVTNAITKIQHSSGLQTFPRRSKRGMGDYRILYYPNSQAEDAAYLILEKGVKKYGLTSKKITTIFGETPLQTQAILYCYVNLERDTERFKEYFAAAEVVNSIIAIPPKMSNNKHTLSKGLEEAGFAKDRVLTESGVDFFLQVSLYDQMNYNIEELIDGLA